MKVKAQSLQEGQKLVNFFGIEETISEVLYFEDHVMVYIAEESDNPFVSSQFNSYSNDTLVEVAS